MVFKRAERAERARKINLLRFILHFDIQLTSIDLYVITEVKKYAKTCWLVGWLLGMSTLVGLYSDEVNIFLQ